MTGLIWVRPVIYSEEALLWPRARETRSDAGPNVGSRPVMHNSEGAVLGARSNTGGMAGSDA